MNTNRKFKNFHVKQAKPLKDSPNKKCFAFLRRFALRRRNSLTTPSTFYFQQPSNTPSLDKSTSILPKKRLNKKRLPVSNLKNRRKEKINLDDILKNCTQLRQNGDHREGGKCFFDQNVLTFQTKDTVESSIEKIRNIKTEIKFPPYVYVLSEKGKLKGVLSIRKLFTSANTKTLSQIMETRLMTINVHAQEEILEKQCKHRFLALPVVNHDNEFLGIATFYEAIKFPKEKQLENKRKPKFTEQVAAPSYLSTSVWSIFRKRFFWLLILFIAEAYTGTVIAHYEETLTKVVALAFFIPLLVGTGGNTGTQVTTTLVRAIAVGEVTIRDMYKIVRKEIMIGFLLGLAFACFALVRSSLLHVGINISFVVAITAMCIVIWSSIISSFLPFILKKLKLDPAIVSGPFITTFVDGTGLVIYFTIANLLLDL